MSEIIERFNDDRVDLTLTANRDRAPLIVKEENGQHWIGVAGPDGEMLPMAAVRRPKAYRPLALDDLLTCWHTSSDYFEICRLGAMGFDDLLAAVHWAEYKAEPSPSLLSQSLQWFWWRISAELMDDRTTTVESLRDSEGNSPLDLEWRTAL